MPNPDGSCQDTGCGCVQVPYLDTDANGDPWPADTLESASDYPPNSPYHDGDGDEIPDCFDGIILVTDSEGTQRPGSNGKLILPSDPVLRDALIDGVFFELGYTGDPPSWSLPSNLDLNNDGEVSFGEAMRASEIEIRAELNAVYLADRNNPTIASSKAFLETVARLAEPLNAVTFAMCDMVPGACAGRVEYAAAMRSVASAAVIRETIAGAEKELLALGAFTREATQLLGDGDGGNTALTQYKDAAGVATSQDGKPQPISSKGNQSTTGDPVNTANGEFTLDASDVELPGRGVPFALSRHYGSHSLTHGMLGHNWSMPMLETRAIIWPAANAIEVHWGDGTQDVYLWNNAEGLYVGEGDEFSKLRYQKSVDCTTGQPGPTTLAIRKRDGTLWAFCPPSIQLGIPRAVCWLSQVSDPYGNALTIRRNDDGKVKELIDTLGRTITFQYNAENLLESVSIPWMEPPQVITYGYDLERHDLTQVTREAVPHLDDDGMVTLSPYIDEYLYDTHPAGWLPTKDASQNHNIISVRRNGVVQVALEYYKATDVQLANPDTAYAVDKVKQQTTDGKTQQFRYYEVNVGPVLDPYDDQQQPRISRRTDVLHADGVLHRFYHGNGLLYRKEIVNDRFSSSWVSLGQQYTAPNESTPVGVWMEIFEYNAEFQITRQLLTDDRIWPGGRWTDSIYDDQSLNKYARAAAIQINEGSSIDSLSRSWHVVHDPVSGLPARVQDPLGRLLETVFDHQELSYTAARNKPNIAGWNVLPLDEVQCPIAFGLQDQNGDGFIGRSYKAIKHLEPEVPVAPPEPGTPQLVQPQTVYRWTRFGEIATVCDPSGVWTTFTRTWYSPPQYYQRLRIETHKDSHSLVQTRELDPRGKPWQITEPNGALTVIERDAHGRVSAVHYRPAATGSGATEADGSPVPTAFSGPHDQTDGQDVVVDVFYDIAGRQSASSVPRFASHATSSYQTSGATPPLAERSFFDSAGNIVKQSRYKRNAAGAIQEEFTSEYLYDGNGNVVEQETSRGAKFEFEFDPRWLMIASTRKDSTGATRGVSTRGYDSFGQLVRSSSPGLNAETADYDGLGRLREGVLPNGSRLELDVDLADRVEQERVRIGSTLINQVTTQYDSHDRTIRRTTKNIVLGPAGSVATNQSPADIVEEYGYSARPGEQLWRIVSPAQDPLITVWSYDWLGRVIREQPGTGQCSTYTVYEWNTMDQLVAKLEHLDDRGVTGTSSPSERLTRHGYDRHGFARVELSPLGHVTRTYCNARGLPEVTLSPSGTRLNLSYDQFGHVVQTQEIGWDGLSRTQSAVWTTDGHQAEQVDPRGNITRYHTDELGRRRWREFEDQRRITYDYNDRDQLSLVEMPSVSRIHAYNAAGELSSITATGAGASVARTIAYDGLGRACRWTDQTGDRAAIQTDRYHYASNQVIREVIQGQNLLGSTCSFYRDGRRLRTNTVTPGASSGRSYDVYGRLQSVSVGSNPTAIQLSDVYGYSQYRTMQAGPGSFGLTFDPHGRVVNESLSAPSVSRSVGSYFNLAANLETRTYAPTSATESYAYDGFDRMSSALVDVIGGTPSQRNVAWQNDLADNITSIVDSVWGTVTAPTANDLNQISALAPDTTSVSWTLNGQVSDVVRGTQGVHWEWDALGRPYACHIASAGAPTMQIEYRYDGLDRLIRRTRVGAEWAEFTYDDGEVSAIATSSGWTTYVSAARIDRPMLRVLPSGAQEAMWTDAVGNVVGLTGNQGTMDQFTFDPYGVRRTVVGAESAPGITDLSFVGRWRDPDVGVHVLGARIYDARLGSFLSRDPLEESAGPNLYAYAKRNPLRWHDSSGWAPEEHQGPEGHGRLAYMDGRGVDVGAESLAALMNDWLDKDGGREKVLERFGYLISGDHYFEKLNPGELMLVAVTFLETPDGSMTTEQAGNYKNSFSHTYMLAEHFAANQQAIEEIKAGVKDPVRAFARSAAEALDVNPEWVDRIDRAASVIGLLRGNLGSARRFSTTLGARGSKITKPTIVRDSPGHGQGAKALEQIQPTGRPEVRRGQYVNDRGRIEPWEAHYDKYGRQVERTDWNAGNRAAGKPDIHHELREFGPNSHNHGPTIQAHVPGVGPRSGGGM